MGHQGKHKHREAYTAVATIGAEGASCLVDVAALAVCPWGSPDQARGLRHAAGIWTPRAPSQAT